MNIGNIRQIPLIYQLYILFIIPSSILSIIVTLIAIAASALFFGKQQENTLSLNHKSIEE